MLHLHALDYEAAKTRQFFLDEYGTDFILSLEGFIGTTHNFGLNGYMTREHALRLKDTFPDAQIMLFIRRQPDIIASAYYQYLTGGGNFSVNKYLNRKFFRGLNGLPLFSYSFFEYDKTISTYCDLFPANRVHVFLYEDFQSDPAAFCTKFSERFNFKVDTSTLDFYPEKQKMRVGIKHLARFASLFTARKMMNKYYLVNLPYWFPLYKKYLNKWDRYPIFGPRPQTIDILGTKNYDRICSYYKNSNRNLIKKYQLTSIEEYHYPL